MEDLACVALQGGCVVDSQTRKSYRGAQRSGRDQLVRVPMTEPLILALVAGGSAVLGGAVTGMFAYVAAVKQRETEQLRRRLIQAYRDIAAFHQLEDRYTKALASESHTADAWKREIRKGQREDGLDSPSPEATALRSEQRIAQLE